LVTLGFPNTRTENRDEQNEFAPQTVMQLSAPQTGMGLSASHTAMGLSASQTIIWPAPHTAMGFVLLTAMEPTPQTVLVRAAHGDGVVRAAQGYGGISAARGDGVRAAHCNGVQNPAKR
jgi:hypothetical protein